MCKHLSKVGCRSKFVCKTLLVKMFWRLTKTRVHLSFPIGVSVIQITLSITQVMEKASPVLTWSSSGPRTIAFGFTILRLTKCDKKLFPVCTCNKSGKSRFKFYTWSEFEVVETPGLRSHYTSGALSHQSSLRDDTLQWIGQETPHKMNYFVKNVSIILIWKASAAARASAAVAAE